MVHLWFIFFSLLLQSHHWKREISSGNRENKLAREKAYGVRSLADKKRSPANTKREVQKNERRLFGCAGQMCLIVLVSLVVTQLASVQADWQSLFAFQKRPVLYGGCLE